MEIGLPKQVLPHTRHIHGIFSLDIGQKHISVYIGLKCGISHLCQIEDRLIVVAVSIIRDSYQKFVKRTIAGIKVGELEEIVFGRLSVVSEEIGVGKHLIGKDIVWILIECTQSQSLGKRKISVFEEGKRN